MKMKNSFWLGLLLGLIFPLLAFLLSNYTALATKFPTGKEGILYMIAAGLNLLALRFLYKRDRPLDQIAKGVIAITFLAMLAFLYAEKISI